MSMMALHQDHLDPETVRETLGVIHQGSRRRHQDARQAAGFILVGMDTRTEEEDLNAMDPVSRPSAWSGKSPHAKEPRPARGSALATSSRSGRSFDRASCLSHLTEIVDALRRRCP